ARSVKLAAAPANRTSGGPPARRSPPFSAHRRAPAAILSLAVGGRGFFRLLLGLRGFACWLHEVVLACSFGDDRLLFYVRIVLGHQLVSRRRLFLQLSQLVRQILFPRPAALRMFREARTSRYQASDDDVFLQATQVVAQTSDRSFCKHAGCLLERGRGNKRLRCQGGLGDTEKNWFDRQRILVLDLELLGDFQSARSVGLLSAQEIALTRIGYQHLPEHLADDHFDVLVVDLDALQAVHVLDLADEIVGQGLDALQAQDVVRIRLAIGDDFAAHPRLALEDVQVTPLRDQLLVAFPRLVRNDETTLALGFLAEADGTGVLGHDRRVFWFPRLEQVGHPGQTAGDIARLGRLLRNTRDDVAHLYLGAVAHADDCARRQGIHGRDVGIREADILADVVHQPQIRPHVTAGHAALVTVRDE